MPSSTEREPVRSIDVSEGDRPDPNVIAARIDLGSAEYHEQCCPFSLWTNDESLFESMPECLCGGPEMAKAYVEMAEHQRQERRLDSALRDARAELMKWGWGDMHYGTQRQDKQVLETLNRIDIALNGHDAVHCESCGGWHMAEVGPPWPCQGNLDDELRRWVTGA